jgi:hypothetical protein
MAVNLLYGRAGSLKNSDLYGWASPGYFLLRKPSSLFAQRKISGLYIAPDLTLQTNTAIAPRGTCAGALTRLHPGHAVPLATEQRDYHADRRDTACA